MHFGMVSQSSHCFLPCLTVFPQAGWLKVKNVETSYYKPEKAEEQPWPPKYWKFILQTKEEPSSEVSYVDLRRFGRIRLIDCAADEIRNVSPLKENGPDPVQDPDVFTEDWLKQKVKSKHVPIKALLLDQGNISGIGNWVGSVVAYSSYWAINNIRRDELLYNAKIHPEQYSDTLADSQITQLYKSINYICNFAVDCLSDSSKFPEEWLFKHRWGKGKKDATNTLPNGKRFVYITVGGRTSAVVPSVQKKTGPVAGDVKAEDEEAANGNSMEAKPKKGKAKSKTSTKEEAIAGAEQQKTSAKRKKGAVKEEDVTSTEVNGHVESKEESKPPAKKRKSSAKPKTESDKPAPAPKAIKEEQAANTGRRRSARISSG